MMPYKKCNLCGKPLNYNNRCTNPKCWKNEYAKKKYKGESK